MNTKYELYKINVVDRKPFAEFMVQANLVKDMVYIDIPDELIAETFKDKLHPKQIKRLIQFYKDYQIKMDKAAEIRRITKGYPKEVVQAVLTKERNILTKKKTAKNKGYLNRWKKDREETKAIELETLSQMSKVKPRKVKKKPFWHE